MKYLFIILIAAITTFSKEKVAPTLEVDSNSYIVTYQFKTTLSDSDLYKTFFKYENISQYMGKTMLTISLLEEQDYKNSINFHYNYLIANLDMRIDRTINKENREVIFQMNNYKRSSKILPLVQNTEGYYKITTKGNNKYVEYMQHTSLDTEIGNIYRKLILRENRKFLEGLIEFIREQETSLLAVKSSKL